SVARFRGRPRSTLFPYTTLFRSHRREDGVDADSVGCPFGGERARQLGGGGSGWGGEAAVAPAGLEDERAAGLTQHGVGRSGDVGDRKSTRLNSSHVKISYAVFCL